MLRVGIDTGGTFTDLVWVEAGRRGTCKVPSTPDDPSRAVMAGLARLLGQAGDASRPISGLPAETRVVHGTTVATNALLEGRGAPVALITNIGFEDVLEIGRQDRPSLYDASQRPAEPLVPPARRYGVSGRLGPDGAEETPVDLEAVATAVRAGLAAGAERFAICFLHAYADSRHEEAAAEVARRQGAEVTLSSRVLPEHREYERLSTTVVSAALAPVMTRYLQRLERLIGASRLSVFRSNGGVLSARAAGEEAVQTLLSGPAAGVLGAWRSARTARVERILTFDMGGTSTDVSLCDGGPAMTTETIVCGHPVRLPMIDIRTVGAGGGSIARDDGSGALVVGPESAGADPGPACYGRGDRPTVTDAQLVLGRLPPAGLLGGEMMLDRERGAAAVGRLAGSLGLSVDATAAGILQVANAGMERALRVVSVARGHDPRRFMLFCYGGAGGLHAADLAAAMGLRGVIVPPDAGLFSAAGMLAADVVRDASCSVLADLSVCPRGRRDRLAAPIERRLRREMEAEGVEPGDLRLERSLDLRYRGQSFEIGVPESDDPDQAFHALHEQLYAHARRSVPVQIVNLRVRAVGPTPPIPEANGEPGDGPAPLPEATERVWFAGGRQDTPQFRRQCLGPGQRLTGPAIVSEAGSTTVVPPGWGLRVDAQRNLRLAPEQSQ